MTDTDAGEDGRDEWFIHRFTCPDCGATSRADRAVACFRCGSDMEHEERIGEVTDVAK